MGMQLFRRISSGLPFFSCSLEKWGILAVESVRVQFLTGLTAPTSTWYCLSASAWGPTGAPVTSSIPEADRRWPLDRKPSQRRSRSVQTSMAPAAASQDRLRMTV